MPVAVDLDCHAQEIQGLKVIASTTSLNSLKRDETNSNNLVVSDSRCFPWSS